MPNFGEFRFGENLFGGGAFVQPVYSADLLVFYDAAGNAFSLSDGTSMILTDLRVSGPSRELIGGDVPRGDGKFLSAEYFREYQVEAEGIAVKSTAALLDAFLDAIKASLRFREGHLDHVDAAGTVKRFVATMTAFDELFASRQRHDITKCPWKAVFRCWAPFGTSRGYTSTVKSLTTSPDTVGVTQAGTYKAKGVFVVVFSAASSVTAVRVTNDTTGEYVQYAGSVTAGDAFVFDGENYSVTKNSTAVDFTGTFPHVEPGDNSIRFTVTGTSFAATATAKFKSTFL